MESYNLNDSDNNMPIFFSPELFIPPKQKNNNLKYNNIIKEENKIQSENTFKKNLNKNIHSTTINNKNFYFRFK